MKYIKLLLSCSENKTIELELTEKKKEFDVDGIVDIARRKVYSEKRYSLQLRENNYEIKDLYLYINDCLINTSYDPQTGDIGLKDNIQLFRDYYGFAFLTLEMVLNDESTYVFYSDYLNIMVKNDLDFSNTRSMAQYVYQYQDYLLFDSKMNALDSSAFDVSENNTFESKLIMIKEVVKVYDICFAYFQKNAKFRLEQHEEIGDSRKLNYVDAKTLSFITQHPEYLTFTPNKTPIQHNDKNLFPFKTLIYDNIKDFDTYENRVIVGFLRTVLTEVSDMIKVIRSRLNDFDNIATDNIEYQASAFYIFEMTIQRYNYILSQLNAVQIKLSSLFLSYKDIFNIAELEVSNLPRPTHTFRTVQFYSYIYTMMEQWFRYGLYDFNREEFLAPFLINNQLYECYVLVKVINYFKSRNYELYSAERFLYKPAGSHRNYSDTRYNNTFNFKKGNTFITLYYQPVINNTLNKSNNGISLSRNMNLSFDSSRERTGKYYLPDYLIKISEGNNEFYIILDAKYSKTTSVKSYYIPSLAFKYLVSISTPNNAKLLGICAVNGRDNTSNNLSSVYFDEYSKSEIPRIDILTLSAKPNEGDTQDFNLFDKFFENYHLLFY